MMSPPQRKSCFVERFRIFFVALFACISPLAGSPVAAADAAPRFSETRPLATTEFELANGMRFLLVERPRAAVTVAGWVVASGSASDPAGRTGLAHLMEHMLFQGSSTIGTAGFERERVLLEREDRLFEQLLDARQQKKRSRVRTLERELADLRSQLDALTRVGEFSALYAEAGATGLDARTYEDLTVSFVGLPAEKVELWFWLESDRLLQPVFRQLERERAVVGQERRQRIDVLPGGTFEERLLERFWAGTPYAWNGLGRPDDVARLGRRDLERFFADHYRPQRLTAVLIGPHRGDEIERLARRYFGRLGGSPSAEPEPPDLPALEPGELRGSGPGRPRLQLLYRTVPHGHADAAALEVLTAALGGAGGRLHRRLVVDQALATVAYALHRPLRHAGSLAIVAEPTATIGALRESLDAELERLAGEGLADGELERLQNRLQADHYRRLKEPRALLLQLLIYAGLGDRHHLDTWPEKLRAVSAADVRRVARQYLAAERRVVGRYDRRSAGSGSGPR